MRSNGYIWPLVCRPIVITAAGDYLTRGGEVVSIQSLSSNNDFGCIGTYSTKQRERWHRSGRIFANVETPNDIVKAV